MTREIKKKIARIALMLLLVGGISAPSVLAESITVKLDKTIDTKGTPAIARQKDRYELFLIVTSISEYQVECWCYGGEHSNNCGNPIRDFRVATGNSQIKHADSDKSPYARATIYGNTKENRKKGCWASLRLSNDK